MRLTIEKAGDADPLALKVTLHNASKDKRLWINHRLATDGLGELSLRLLDIGGSGGECEPNCLEHWKGPNASDYTTLAPGDSFSRVRRLACTTCVAPSGPQAVPKSGFKVVAFYRDRHGRFPAPFSYVWFAGTIKSNVLAIQ